MREILASLLAVVIACPVPALASNTALPLRDRFAGDIKQVLLHADITRGTEVAVTLRDRSVITGRVDDIAEHSLFIVDSTTASIIQVAYRNISLLQIPSPSNRTRIIVFSVIGAVIIYALVFVKRL